MCTLLLKLEPGAVVPLHEHTAIEQTYVLEGTFLDEEGTACRASSSGARPAIPMSPGPGRKARRSSASS